MASYRYKSGSKLEIPAQVAGDELDRIARRNGGRLTPDGVVRAAEPTDAPLHPHFEWNDRVAASEWRREQARTLVQSVVIVREDSADETETAFVIIETGPVPERNPFTELDRGPSKAYGSEIESTPPRSQWQRQLDDVERESKAVDTESRPAETDSTTLATESSVPESAATRMPPAVVTRFEEHGLEWKVAQAKQALERWRHFYGDVLDASAELAPLRDAIDEVLRPAMAA